MGAVFYCGCVIIQITIIGVTLMAKAKTTKPVETEPKEPIACVACNGTGLKNGEMGSELCLPCDGSGEV